jgi:hypothetical protein
VFALRPGTLATGSPHAAMPAPCLMWRMQMGTHLLAVNSSSKAPPRALGPSSCSISGRVRAVQLSQDRPDKQPDGPDKQPSLPQVRPCHPWRFASCLLRLREQECRGDSHRSIGPPDGSDHFELLSLLYFGAPVSWLSVTNHQDSCYISSIATKAAPGSQSDGTRFVTEQKCGDGWEVDVTNEKGEVIHQEPFVHR